MLVIATSPSGLCPLALFSPPQDILHVFALKLISCLCFVGVGSGLEKRMEWLTRSNTLLASRKHAKTGIHDLEIADFSSPVQ